MIVPCAGVKRKVDEMRSTTILVTVGMLLWFSAALVEASRSRPRRVNYGDEAQFEDGLALQGSARRGRNRQKQHHSSSSNRGFESNADPEDVFISSLSSVRVFSDDDQYDEEYEYEDNDYSDGEVYLKRNDCPSSGFDHGEGFAVRRWRRRQAEDEQEYFFYNE